MGDDAIAVLSNQGMKRLRDTNTVFGGFAYALEEESDPSLLNLRHHLHESAIAPHFLALSDDGGLVCHVFNRVNSAVEDL